MTAKLLQLQSRNQLLLLQLHIVPVQLYVELVGVLARAVDVHTVVVMGVACNGNVVIIIIKLSIMTFI